MSVFNLGPLGLPIEKVQPQFSFQPEGKTNWISITKSASTTDYTTVQNSSTTYFAYKESKNNNGQIVWELALFRNGKLRIDTTRTKKCYLYIVGGGANGATADYHISDDNSPYLKCGNGGAGAWRQLNYNVELKPNTEIPIIIGTPNSYPSSFGTSYKNNSNDTYAGKNVDEGGRGAFSYGDYLGAGEKGIDGEKAYEGTIASQLFSSQLFGAQGGGGGGYKYYWNNGPDTAEKAAGSGGTTNGGNGGKDAAGSAATFYGAGGGGGGGDGRHTQSGHGYSGGAGANGIILLHGTELPS